MRSTASLGLLAALCTTTITVAASADEVFIYQQKNNDLQGGDGAAEEAALVFESLGHNVTLESSFAPQMPDDLSVFDTVWVISLVPLATPVRTKLIEFAEAGGGIYLTGENVCCEPLNLSLSQVLAPLLRNPSPIIGQTSELGGDLFTPTLTNPFGLTTTPNVLTEWTTQTAGLMSNVPATRAVFQKADGDVGAAAYPPEHFDHGSGCVYLAMDLTFWQANVAPSQDLGPYVENIQAFLNGCADSDGDGLSDEGEEAAGTGVDDPDSDDDGLCDGYGAVAGVCIAGEHPEDNYDGDADIPPLDEDDDDDTLPTSFEVAAEGLAPDADDDHIPTWDDLDSDDDFLLDEEEGPGDYDDDGIPAIVDADDAPPPCSVDADCGPADSGVVCNMDVGYCHPGCRGSNGNGCPDGQLCTSDDETIGSCVDDGGGGGGGAGAGGGGDGGSPPSSGGNGSGGAPAAGGAGGESGDDGMTGDVEQCACRSAGASSSGFGALLALTGLGLLGARRRRR